MDITYSWQFPRFRVYKNLNGLDQVVFNVEWILSATDNEGHGDQLTGTSQLFEPEASDFVPFHLITHDVVQSWIEFGLGGTVEGLKQTLRRKIELYRANETELVSPPW